MKKLSRAVIKCAIFLTAMLLFTVVPASAATVAKIGSRNYSSFDKALAAARNGQTIKLMKNTSHTSGGFMIRPEITKKSVIINLNKKKLTLKDSFTLYNKGKVTFKNGSISFASGGDTHFYIMNHSSAQFTDCKFDDSYLRTKEYSSLKLTRCTMTAKNASIEVSNHSSLVINGGTYKTNLFGGVMFAVNGSKMTVNSGTFGPAKGSSANTSLFGVYPWGSSVNSLLTINGGTFKSNSDAIYLGKNQSCVINKGNISSIKASAVNCYGKIRVKGGTLKGGSLPYPNGAAHAIIAADSAEIRLYSGCTVKSDYSTAIGYYYDAKPKIFKFGGKVIDAK